MGTMDLAVVDPVDMDPEAAVVDEAERAEAVADVAVPAEAVAERAVAVAQLVERAEAGRMARASKAAGTTAAQCRIFAATSVVLETTLRSTAVRKRLPKQRENLRQRRQHRNQN